MIQITEHDEDDRLFNAQERIDYYGHKIIGFIGILGLVIITFGCIYRAIWNDAPARSKKANLGSQINYICNENGCARKRH